LTFDLVEITTRIEFLKKYSNINLLSLLNTIN